MIRKKSSLLTAPSLSESASSIISFSSSIENYNVETIRLVLIHLLISCYNKSFTKLLKEFSKRTNKFLPKKYYCKNKDYIQGLFDGLIDSDGNIEITNTKKYIYNLTNTSKYILELFYWCCMNLNI